MLQYLVHNLSVKSKSIRHSQKLKGNPGIVYKQSTILAAVTEFSHTVLQMVLMLSIRRMEGLPLGCLPGIVSSNVILGYLYEGILLACP